MASVPPKPMLQKPPGYRDPNNPVGRPAAKKPLPPRKLVLPPSLRRKSRYRGCCRRCCCACCITILVLIFAAVTAAGLIYIAYDPYLPVFHLQSFRVPRLNVTEKPDGAYLDAETTTRVEVKNRNSKIVWYFEETSLEVSAENGDLSLGSTKLPGFAVKVKGVRDLKAETRVRGVALDDRQRKKLKGMFKSRELVPAVEVRTRTGVGMEGWNWKSGTLGINVVCGNVTLKKLDDGEMPICTVTILKWIKIR